jgi:COP9 signalosome complex subunit 4
MLLCLTKLALATHPGARTGGDAYRVRTSIRIAMLYLEDDDPVNAEMHIKKASSLIGSVHDEELELQYKARLAP